MAFLLIKTPESSGTLTKAAIAHDEDDPSSVDDLPTLIVNSTIDHRNVYNKQEMTKYLNKSVGVKGKASVPSVG